MINLSRTKAPLSYSGEINSLQSDAGAERIKGTRAEYANWSSVFEVDKKMRKKRNDTTSINYITQQQAEKEQIIKLC